MPLTPFLRFTIMTPSCFFTSSPASLESANRTPPVFGWHFVVAADEDPSDASRLRAIPHPADRPLEVYSHDVNSS